MNSDKSNPSETVLYVKVGMLCCCPNKHTCIIFHVAALRMYFFSVAQIAQVAHSFAYHWLGSLGNLSSNKEIQPDLTKMPLMTIENSVKERQMSLSNEEKLICTELSIMKCYMLKL